MSQANDLLNAVAESTAGSATEGHLVIGRDRYITVPDDLKRVAVQFDNNIETVTFDCPRYWDGKDMSEMMVYVNYMRSDNAMGSFVCENIRVDETDPELMHFDWIITGNVTAVAGPISFLVCIKDTDVEGNEANHWNTELNTDLYVSPGMNCSTESALRKYPDIITQLLLRMDRVEFISPDGWLEFTDIMRAHMSNIENPHEVNVLQLELENVDNTSDMDKPVSNAQRAAIDEVMNNVTSHTGNEHNPHNVTAEQVGLGNVLVDISELSERVETLENTGGGGGNTNSVEITQAEWDAMDDSKFTDDVTYFIPDGDGEEEEGGGGYIEVVDNLLSTATELALSANQGRVLNEKIDNLASGENIGVRYISDETDPNFDYIQVRTSEGNWKNYKKAYLERQWLVQDGLNRAGLKLVSSDLDRGTLTQTEDFLVLYSGLYNDAKAHTTQFSFEETLDFTNYDKLVFEQSSTFPANSNDYDNGITVGVKDIYGNVLASQRGYNGTPTYAEDIILDVSNISEVGSVFIQVTTYRWTTTGESGSATCKLSNVYAT